MLGEVRPESPLVGVPHTSSPDVPPDVSHSSSPAKVVVVAISSSECLGSAGALMYLQK